MFVSSECCFLCLTSSLFMISVLPCLIVRHCFLIFPAKQSIGCDSRVLRALSLPVCRCFSLRARFNRLCEVFFCDELPQLPGPVLFERKSMCSLLWQWLHGSGYMFSLCSPSCLVTATIHVSCFCPSVQTMWDSVLTFALKRGRMLDNAFPRTRSMMMLHTNS